MGKLGFGELILILVVILIFFGGTRIPEIGKGLGKGIREFKSALNDDSSDKDKDKDK